MPYIASLECTVRALEYSFDRRSGRLYVPSADDGPDMLGAIELFKKLDPAVRQIAVLVGSTWATRYTRDRRTGQWEATRQAERVRTKNP